MKKYSKVQPHFYWKLPHNWRYLLSPDADKRFRQKHKFLYILFTLLAVILLFSPPIIYIIILIHVNKNTFGPLGGIGILGAFLLVLPFAIYFAHLLVNISGITSQ